MKAKLILIVVLVVAFCASAVALTPSKYRKIATDSKGRSVGNCIFTTNIPEMGREDTYDVKTQFVCGSFDKLYARCYFPKTKGEYKPYKWQAFFSMGLHDGLTSLSMEPESMNWDQQRLDLYTGGSRNLELDFEGGMQSAVQYFCQNNKSGSVDGYVEFRAVYKEGEHMEYKIEQDKVVGKSKEDRSYIPVASGNLTILAK